ncbi:hypothetical protein B0W47_03995 [Komagataeibacter nataicola]|uniref:Uncharacterized protein n=1 Tax=Komagataeibacter nataicola TaxID=265960 RepID=A0A9N7GZS6_9PROT|nr:hypothetical protein B0W47_03995 [Komagataeibacter nataicola]
MNEIHHREPGFIPAGFVFLLFLLFLRIFYNAVDIQTRLLRKGRIIFKPEQITLLRVFVRKQSS